MGDPYNHYLFYFTDLATEFADYTPVSANLTFLEGGNRTQCLDVTIIDDGVLETSEIFFLTIQPLNGNVSALSDATINIDDDDGM